MQLQSLTFSSRKNRAGFTFLEVLFAVIVLGIGFILIAAMFPAAIKQTLATVEESAASSVWLSLHRKFIEIGKNQVLPATAPPKYVLDQNLPATGTGNSDSKVYSFNDVRLGTGPKRALIWQTISANIILDSDFRYACMPLFRRDIDTGNPLGAAEVQLILIPVRSRNKPQYDFYDVGGPKINNSTVMANLNPTLMEVEILPPNVAVGAFKNAPDGPSIGFSAIYDVGRVYTGVTPKRTALAVGATDTPVGVGAYVIISDSPLNPLKNGNIYRLGAAVSGTDSAVHYYIAPDPQGSADVYDAAFKAYRGNFAFVIGRGISTSAGTTFDGPIEPLGVFPAPIRVRPGK